MAMHHAGTDYGRAAGQAVLDKALAERRISLRAPEGKTVRDAYGIRTPGEGLGADAGITGVQMQQMLPSGHELVVGATTVSTFDKIVAFGLGGVLVEVPKDVTFRLAPTTREESLSMLDCVAAAEVLRGVRGAEPVGRDSLVDLVNDFPQLAEVDPNPALATPTDATAVDVRILVDENVSHRTAAFSQEQQILDRKVYRSIADVPGEVDVAAFTVPAKFVLGALEETGRKGVAGAFLIPSGFGETDNQELQDQVVAAARKHDVRVLGPNIYGYYYTPEKLSATFCTPYAVKGGVALSSQSGGIGMPIPGLRRSAKMGVSSAVGVDNKTDIDGDDLLTFVEQDGTSSNPVDITDGEPLSTYCNTIKLGLDDERIHALILGYWYTIVTPPMVFAGLVSEVVEEGRQRGIHKLVVASLSSDAEVEEASDYLFRHGIVAYPYTTEKPVAVLGAKYRWARAAKTTTGLADWRLT